MSQAAAQPPSFAGARPAHHQERRRSLEIIASCPPRLPLSEVGRYAQRIESLARTGHGLIFVVVGAGHLIGPDGVPALLRRDGLEVKGP